ncbi:6-phosphogluconolactonase [Chitinimonas sp. BJB300]|uniref:6-phosphogluconolactonase n=1 Tax=Chitinimonas sp. BJB300 TaxID=1559339 RepID=UPI000C0D44D2|nr:6-phosphogluconolactonase [Chitinimonas sp. BJB300]PHV11842.1 6-phosphogluconolactonase [Chitinimonas sp. BJB300]TSJ88634.1 6-phosphogluconolactonase [Chitinimonas sp. BJB300]
MADIRIHDYDSRVDLDICLAREVAAALETALRERGTASLAVSGGRTPVGMFQQLRQMRLDWSRVWITLIDDRWLPVDHADSNERLVRENLLKYQVEAANFIGLKTAASTPEAGIADIEAALAAMPQPFDVVTLGMGEDGHTASLFPCSAELKQATALDGTKLVAAVNPTTAPYARISFTLAAIARSRNIFLHLTGEKKKAVFDAAMAAPSERLPIARVFDAASGVCHLYWAE